MQAHEDEKYLTQVRYFSHAKTGWKVSHSGEAHTYNYVHNILRLFDGWTNSYFTTSQLERDYL